MVSYNLILKNDRKKFYKSFSVFILVLNALAICLFLYYYPKTLVQRATAVTCAVLAVSVIVYREKMRNSRHTETGIYAVMIALALYWAVIGFWWAAGIVLLLTVLYYFASQVPEVQVSAAGVRYPAFPPRSIQWAELNNLVLKDGLLTIDFRNNRIIQQLLDPAVKSPEEREINEFCHSQIRKAR